MKTSVLTTLLTLTLLSNFSYAENLCLALLSGQRVPETTWGANFLNRYESFDFAADPLSLGVEIEATVPRRIGQSGLSRIIEDEVQRSYPNSDVTNESNIIRYEKEGIEYSYVVGTDITIHPKFRHDGVELKSPILRDQEDIDLFHRIVSRLKKEGNMKPSPTTAGVHVHVGFPGGRAQEIAMVANLFAAIEKQVARTFSVVNSRRKRWAQWTDKEIKDLLEANKVDDLTIDEILSKVNSRYRGLNLRALSSHGTVEFRLFNSTVEPIYIQLMLNFASGLVKAVREKDPRLIHFLNAHQNKKELPFDELIETLDLDLGKSRTIVNRLHRQTLKEVWKSRLTGMPAFITAVWATSVGLFSWMIFF